MPYRQLYCKTRALPRELMRTVRRIPKTALKEAKGRNKSYGYLHIGKTGGTTIGALMDKAVAQGYAPPINFGHGYTLQHILQEHPDIRLAITLRDPIERMVSGFNSRLRQSRPAYTAPWTTDEAIGYLWFPTVTDFFKARVSQDQRLLSAALFSEKAFGHVYHGYAYHFHSAEYLAKHLSRFYFAGSIDGLSEDIHEYFRYTDVPETFTREHIQVKHSGGKSTGHELENLDPDLLNAIREIYRAEYDIYDFLLKNRAQICSRN